MDYLNKEAVSEGMSTALAIVLLVGFGSLKHVTTLAVMESRGEVVECLGLKSCWEWRVSRVSTMVWRCSHSKIFATKILVALDDDIECELFEGEVHAEFGLSQTGDQHLVTVKEIL